MAAKRKSDGMISRLRTKARFVRTMESSTKDLRAEIAVLQKRIAHLEANLEDTKKAVEKAEREAAKAAAGEAEARAQSANDTESAANKVARLRDINMKLTERLDELEDSMTQLTDMLEEEGYIQTVNGLERARDAQTAADEKVDDALYEGEDKAERVRGPPRKHGFKVRVAIHKLLALGIDPSRVIPSLSVAEFEFPAGVPTLDFVRKMRSETNIVLMAMAATTAADPAVSFVFHA